MAVGAVDPFELDPSPRRDRRGVELGDQARRAAAQGDERDPHLVERLQVGVGGELGVEHELGRQPAVRCFQNSAKRSTSSAWSACARPRWRIRTRAAQRLGQERQHPFLAAAALGHVVLLDQRVLTVNGIVWKSR